MSLIDLPQHESAQIQAINHPGEMGDRLMEMGLTPGAAVKVLSAGMAGQPMQILVRGYRLSLRNSDAQCIEVST